MAGSSWLFEQWTGLSTRLPMPLSLLSSRPTQLGAHRLRRHWFGDGCCQQLYHAFPIHGPGRQQRLRQHFGQPTKARSPRPVMPHDFAQFAFDLRMRPTRFLVLRRSCLLLDFSVLRLVIVLDDDAATLLGRILVALVAQRTIGTWRGFELVTIAWVLACAAALPGLLTGGAGHFAVLRVDDRQRKTLRSERV